jgi:hypothetical protein
MVPGSVVVVQLTRVGRLLAGLALAAVLVASALGSPASAGQLAGCCICQGCPIAPATQCFESPAQGCQTQCSVLACTGFSDTAIACGEQPQCSSFTAPAPAPALGPGELALAALVLTGFGLRALRRGR